MRVLVTGGSGFIGSHVVDKLRARGHEPVIYDLRRSPWHEPGIGRHACSARSPTARRSSARCTAATRSRTWPRSPTSTTSHAEPEDAERVNARGTVTVLEAAPARRGQADRLRVARSGSTRDCEHEAVDEDTLLPRAEPPLHEHQARRRAVLQGLPGAVRDRLHDPALRHPVRPSRTRGRGHPGVRQQGADGRAAHARRRRRPVAAVRVRRGPRRRRRARARADVATNRVYNLASDENVTIKQIAETRPGADRATSRSSTRRRAPATSAARSSAASAPSTSSAGRRATPFSGGRADATSSGAASRPRAAAGREAAAVIPAGEPDAESHAAPGPDHLRRHR